MKMDLKCENCEKETDTWERFNGRVLCGKCAEKRLQMLERIKKVI